MAQFTTEAVTFRQGRAQGAGAEAAGQQAVDRPRRRARRQPRHSDERDDRPAPPQPGSLRGNHGRGRHPRPLARRPGRQGAPTRGRPPPGHERTRLGGIFRRCQRDDERLVSVVSRGIRNAFRNATRTIAIVAILGLNIGLSFVMLIGRSEQDRRDARFDRQHRQHRSGRLRRRKHRQQVPHDGPAEQGSARAVCGRPRRGAPRRGETRGQNRPARRRRQSAATKQLPRAG